MQFELCRQLLDHFGKKLGILVRYTDNLYEDVTYRISGNEVRTAMGCDVVVTGAGPDDRFIAQKFDDGTWLNEYGMRMRQGTIYVEVAEYPLANIETAMDVAAYTQNQALCALVFLYKQVLKMDLPEFDEIVWAKKPRKLSVVLSRAEVKAVLDHLSGTYWLAASLLYGRGCA